MTDMLLRRTNHTVAPMQPRDADAAVALCDLDPVLNVVVRMHLDRARAAGSFGGLWTVRKRRGTGDDPMGLVYAGANLWPVLPNADPDVGDTVIADVARTVRVRVRRPAAIVGERTVVAAIWKAVERAWGPARLVRERQLSLALFEPPHRLAPPPTGALEPVRLSEARDFDDLLPACVHMFRAEVGYDPMSYGRQAYEARLKALIGARWSFLQYGEADGRRQVVFKAEVGAVAGGVAQVQGVWVHPELRGAGVAKASLGEAMTMIQREVAPTVSLYVNDFNASAIGVYRALGMRQGGLMQTVMF